MSAPVLIHALALSLSAGLTLWVAFRALRTPGVGRRRFVLLSSAIAVWCFAGIGHALTPELNGKLVWAKVQYLGIASVAPLWFLFTAEYAGAAWFSRRAESREARLATAALWAIPAVTVLLAATNEWHRAVWANVRLDGARAVYTYGPWFWVAAGYSYILVLGGTVLVARMLRRSPPQLRGQFVALLAAAAVPWAANLMYLSGALPIGIDVTPLGFAVSGVLFAWALSRSHLFQLVPVARDLVIDSLDDAMIVVDRTRRIIDLNAAGHRLARRKRRSTDVGGTWIGEAVERVFPLMRDVPLEAGTRLATSKWVTTAGFPACFEVRVLPVEVRTTFAAWAILLRDVTTERQAAAERDALRERMQEQQRRESLSILAAGLAHDFNNLLAGIVGNADLLSMQVPASSSMGSSVGAILLGAQRAADLVAKMLAYAGERHGSIARMDLGVVVRELLDLLRASAARHCAVHFHGGPAIIEGDATQVRQVAMNLIINAAEAVDEGTGTVTVTTGTQLLDRRQLVEMRFGQEAVPGEYAFIDVRDDGPGMTDDVLQRIFQPFFSTKESGHGLGLAAVHGIVHGHRGALKVESHIGWGSRFCVWFPVARVVEQAEPVTAELPAAAVR